MSLTWSNILKTDLFSLVLSPVFDPIFSAHALTEYFMDCSYVLILLLIWIHCGDETVCLLIIIS